MEFQKKRKTKGQKIYVRKCKKILEGDSKKKQNPITSQSTAQQTPSRINLKR